MLTKANTVIEIQLIPQNEARMFPLLVLFQSRCEVYYGEMLSEKQVL